MNAMMGNPRTLGDWMSLYDQNGGGGPSSYRETPGAVSQNGAVPIVDNNRGPNRLLWAISQMQRENLPQYQTQPDFFGGSGGAAAGTPSYTGGQPGLNAAQPGQPDRGGSMVPQQGYNRLAMMMGRR